MNRKRLLFFMLLFPLILVFASDAEDFINLLGNNSGFYYNEADCEVLYLGKTANKVIQITSYSVNFDSNTIKAGSIGSSFLLNYSPSQLSLYKTDFEINNGKIDYFLFQKKKYLPVPFSEENKIAAFMKSLADKKFSRLIGEYHDAKLERTFVILKPEDKFILLIISQDGKTLEHTLEIRDSNNASGEACSIAYFSDKLYFYLPDARGQSGYYNSVFDIDPVVEQTGERSKTVDLYKNSYPFGLNKQKLSLNENDKKIYILRPGEKSSESIIEKFSHSYNIFLDAYGYKHIEFKDEKFVIIDGYTQNFAFNYHTEKMNDDKEMLEAVFKKYPEDWTSTEYYGGYKNINGAYFCNVKASSFLVDKYHEYVPEGIMKVFNPSEYPRLWVRNNIPWVEGKDGDGIDEYIEFEIIPIEWRAVTAINLRILNGYVDPLKPYLFRENNRLKKALLETDSGIKKEIFFNDIVEFTSIQLPKETKKLRITIKEVYKGSKYQDTCISAVDMYYDLWDK